MYATNFFEHAILNLLRGNNITAPSTMYLALYLSNPGDDNTGTEVSYSGYERQQITFSEPTASNNGLMIQNTAQISFPESGSSIGNVTHVGVLDNSNNLWLYGQLSTPLNVQTGVTPVIRQNSVKWIFSGNLSAYYRRNIMNVLRGYSCSGFTPYVGLCNGDPTAEGGNEFNGASYARMAVSFDSPTQQASGTAQVKNDADILSPTALENWGNLTHIAVFDSQTGGYPFGIIPLGTTYSMLAGSAAGFHAGNLKFNVN